MCKSYLSEKNRIYFCGLKIKFWLDSGYIIYTIYKNNNFIFF